MLQIRISYFQKLVTYEGESTMKASLTPYMHNSTHVATRMPHLTEYWIATCISSSIRFRALMQGLSNFLEPLQVSRCEG